MSIIETEALQKTYHAAGGDVVALDGVDLRVEQGEFFGLLGPNGAGKTTTIGILTTRVRPTGGSARIAGHDVVTDSTEVKRRIGVVPQRPNPDRGLTIIENLTFHAAYFGIPYKTAKPRADDLLARFELTARANAKVDHLSGGQQQRLMIARALMHEPEVIFLDEPTSGLDPQARHAVWDLMRELQKEGRTIVLTTHYLEEADQLCDRVAIIDRGKMLALDTPDALKAQAPGGTLIELMLEGENKPVTARVDDPEQVAETVQRLIADAKRDGKFVRDVHLAPPSLETLFISLTGRRID